MGPWHWTWEHHPVTGLHHPIGLYPGASSLQEAHQIGWKRVENSCQPGGPRLPLQPTPHSDLLMDECLLLQGLQEPSHLVLVCDDSSAAPTIHLAMGQMRVSHFLPEAGGRRVGYGDLGTSQAAMHGLQASCWPVLGWPSSLCSSWGHLEIKCQLRGLLLDYGSASCTVEGGN